MQKIWGKGTDRIKFYNRQEMVPRLSQAGSPFVAVISEETGVPKVALYAWLSTKRRSGCLVKVKKDPLIMTKRSKPRSPTAKLDLIAIDVAVSSGARVFKACEAIQWCPGRLNSGPRFICKSD